jgi:outer membrane lipoprotein carrier protein
MLFLCRTLLGFLLITSLNASPIDSKKELIELLTPINGFSTNFNQSIIDAKGELVQSQSGKLHVQKPNKLYWTVFEPSEQSIVRDGIHLWLYDPDLGQVIIQLYKDTPESNPISLLMGDPKNLSETFQIVAHHRLTNSVQQFILKPFQLNALYTDITIEFTAESLSAFSFTDNLDQKTQMTLKKFTLNPQFKENFFTFEVPSGVDIVDHAN